MSSLAPDFAATPDSRVFAQATRDGAPPSAYLVHEQISWVHRLWRQALGRDVVPAAIPVRATGNLVRTVNPVGLTSPTRSEGTRRLYFTPDDVLNLRSPTLRVRNVADIRITQKVSWGVKTPDPITGLICLNIGGDRVREVKFVAVGAVDPRLKPAVIVASESDGFSLAAYLQDEAAAIATEVGLEPEAATRVLVNFLSSEFASEPIAEMWFEDEEFDLDEGELKELSLKIAPFRPGRMMFAVSLADVASPWEPVAVSLPMILRTGARGSISIFTEQGG